MQKVAGSSPAILSDDKGLTFGVAWLSSSSKFKLGAMPPIPRRGILIRGDYNHPKEAPLLQYPLRGGSEGYAFENIALRS